MSNGPGALNQFIRGGQYFAHIVQMVMQNFARGLGICFFIAIAIGSWFYIKTLDGYDKYIISHEVSAVIKGTLPLAREEYEKHIVELYSPDGPDQQYARILLRDRRSLPWYEYERSKTMAKVNAAIWLTVIDSLIVLILLSIVSQYLGRAITNDKQTRGARKVSKRELIRLIRAFNKREARKMKMPTYVPYEIDGVPYPLLTERQHTLLAGSTGTGKTQLLLKLMAQIRERNDRCIAYDKMCSYVPGFYNPETDKLLNPLDDRCPPWDIFSDARDLVEWNAIADAIIQSKSADPYWTEGAKAIFACTGYRLAEECKQMGTQPTLTSLLYLLTQSTVEELHNFLKGTEAARHINPAADKQSASMLSTLSQSITPLGFLKDSTPDNPGFSIRRWMADDTLKGTLFLTSSGDQHATIQPLLTMWMSLCNTALMSQPRSNDRLCWFLIDELPSLNRLPDLEDGLAQARQFGGAYVLGIQLESQLEEIYETKGAQSIMGLTLNKAIFSAGDAKTAKTMADAIGKTEVIRRNEGISLGAKRIRDGVNMNSQITQEHIVLPEELMSMPNLQFVLKMRGDLPCTVMDLKYQPIENKHEGYIPDPNYMERFKYKMSSTTHNDAATFILDKIRQEKSGEPTGPGFIATPTQSTVPPHTPTVQSPPNTRRMSVITPVSEAATASSNAPRNSAKFDTQYDEEDEHIFEPSDDYIAGIINEEETPSESHPIYNESIGDPIPPKIPPYNLTGKPPATAPTFRANVTFAAPHSEETDGSGDRAYGEHELEQDRTEDFSEPVAETQPARGPDDIADVEAKNRQHHYSRQHIEQVYEGGSEATPGEMGNVYAPDRDR